jgi:hypothetical protein
MAMISDGGRHGYAQRLTRPDGSSETNLTDPFYCNPSAFFGALSPEGFGHHGQYGNTRKDRFPWKVAGEPQRGDIHARLRQGDRLKPVPCSRRRSRIGQDMPWFLHCHRSSFFDYFTTSQHLPMTKFAYLSFIKPQINIFYVQASIHYP